MTTTQILCIPRGGCEFVTEQHNGALNTAVTTVEIRTTRVLWVMQQATLVSEEAGTKFY
jgi:hypothetical protein